jgi:hypothetical protein
MSQEKFTLPEQKKFILFGEALAFVNRGGTQAISIGYVDNTGVFGDAGTYVEYISAKDSKTGKLIAKRYRFDQSLGRLQTRETDRDITGKSQYLFLKNHPSCEGSPNGTYRPDANGQKKQVGAIFREYDPDQDAKTALEADKLRVSAQATAMNLDDETLEEIANILGHYVPVNDAMRVRVIEFAGKRSDQFNDLMKAGDRSLRALVRKALSVGEFTKKGSLIMWSDTLMGSEDDAILILSKDQGMIDSLKSKLKLLVDVKAEKPVNKGGRPKKTE